jgi:hypothetical protein
VIAMAEQDSGVDASGGIVVPEDIAAGLMRAHAEARSLSEPLMVREAGKGFRPFDPARDAKPETPIMGYFTREQVEDACSSPESRALVQKKVYSCVDGLDVWPCGEAE